MREITVTPSGPRPGTRYFRSIEGADFSLAANTENVPRDGRYYIRQGGEITFSSSQLGDVRELYEGLCNGYWRMLMQSSDRAERIAGLFRGDDEKAKWRLRLIGHRGAPSLTPTMKTFARSAAAVTSAASAMMVEPAATATPASPARAAPSLVRGPIEGRSKRRSWPGFGALTRTPTPPCVVTLLCRRRPAIRARLLLVPYASSTASSLLLATIAACPTSNGPSVAINVMPRAMSLKSRSVG